VRRPGRRSFAATFPFPQAGLRVGRFTWRVVSGWGDPSCRPESEEPPVDPEEPPVDPDDPLPDGPLPLPRSADRRPPCVDAEPNRGRYRGVVRRPRIVGCTRDEHMLSTSGPRRSHRVALTFDDGPSSYTGTVLDILEHKHVDATFFVIGDNIPGRTGLLRRMIREGHEIANHSLHHETNGASAASIRETSARIHSATGFRSCLYRPPGGYRSSGAFSAAWKLGMSNVLWDVDPRDWSQPGSGAIYSRVTSATRAGSIILLHDGGGDRSQTIAALDDIISNLKNRGYRFVTVSKLLRERYRWHP
jgi:peptidoglycan/xylan/chitin deacetylase (PgdA/CDA1 family)